MCLGETDLKVVVADIATLAIVTAANAALAGSATLGPAAEPACDKWTH